MDKLTETWIVHPADIAEPGVVHRLSAFHDEPAARREARSRAAYHKQIGHGATKLAVLRVAAPAGHAVTLTSDMRNVVVPGGRGKVELLAWYSWTCSCGASGEVHVAGQKPETAWRAGAEHLAEAAVPGAVASQPHPMKRAFPSDKRCVVPGCGKTSAAAVHRAARDEQRGAKRSRAEQLLDALAAGLADIRLDQTEAEILAMYECYETPDLARDVPTWAVGAAGELGKGERVAAIVSAREMVRRAIALRSRSDRRDKLDADSFVIWAPVAAGAQRPAPMCVQVEGGCVPINAPGSMTCRWCGKLPEAERPAPAPAPARPRPREMAPARKAPKKALSPRVRAEQPTAVRDTTAKASLPPQARPAVVEVSGFAPGDGYELMLKPGTGVGTVATAVRVALNAARGPAQLAAAFHVSKGKGRIGLLPKPGSTVKDWGAVLALAAATVAEHGALADAS